MHIHQFPSLFTLISSEISIILLNSLKFLISTTLFTITAHDSMKQARQNRYMQMDNMRSILDTNRYFWRKKFSLKVSTNRIIISFWFL